ncbi:MAG TPA: DUF4197 domain-containing protein [Verrucomicrobiae bacterium]|nr:DUF4197 domain-containing protein [Verrucomicrobiae bacterium]
MKTFLVITTLLASLTISRAGFLDQLQALTTTNQSVLTSSNLAGLSQDQMIQGLKEALGKGVQTAIASLGRNDGFLTNLNVKIPMPGKLKSVEKALRTIKQEKLADEFVDTLNHAAEQAAPEAAGVFSDSIQQMTIADAKAILAGTNNAATEYFRRTTQANLYAKFLPIVKVATGKAGVTAAYKNMMSKVAVSSQVSGPLGSTELVKPEDMDIDAYVTQKAMDGLFTMVAVEEKQIRENPVARTTAVLKQVFGAAAK